MKNSLLLALATAFCASLSAQEAPQKGWTFFGLPIISFSTDIGLGLGAYGDLFYYDKGEKDVFPYEKFHAGFAGAYSLKGSWYIHGFMDSRHLIPGVNIIASATYMDIFNNNFYGFNGIAAPYLNEWDLNRSTRTAFYTNKKTFARVSAVTEGKINDKFSWMAGGVFRWIRVQDFDLENYRSGHSLYLHYIDAGLIGEDEKNGGASIELKAGAKFDTRDNAFNPNKGILASAYLLSNFCLSGGKYHYGQLAVDFRHFVPIIKERIVFAWHLALQQQLWGEMPFYTANELETTNYRYEEFSGLGSRYSIRGYRYNRITAAGYAWANFEMRLTPFVFDLARQHVELMVIPFGDLGAITRNYRLDKQKALGASFYQDISLPVMASAGIGFKAILNKSFMLAVDFAKAFHPQINDFMVGMSSSYVF